MSETEPASSADAFLQGDILEIVPQEGGRVTPQYGIVINADCDLAHCKIDGVIAYIPLFPFEVFFEKFWIPTFSSTRREELIEAISARCGLTTVECLTIFDWLKDEPAELVVSKLCEAYKVKPSDIQERVEELAILGATEVFDSTLLAKLAKFQKGTTSEIILRHARRALKNLGEGNFFINEVAGLSNVGFVARMRRIYSLDADCVFSSRSNFVLTNTRSPIVGIRIAKLSNLYRFKIAQLFAYQFSRIGLPDEITSLNEVAVEAAISNLRWKE